MPEPLQPYLQAAIEMGKEAGSILKQFWGNLESVESKEESIDLVTEADKISEKIILDNIQKRFPSHAFLGEESGESPIKSDYLWIVDPLDGTTNYTHEYPMVSISIALAIGGETMVGVVFNPILEEFFHAVKGEGAYLNRRVLHVSRTSSLGRALLSTGFPYNRRAIADNNYAQFCRLTHLCQGVRRGGSAALDLAYVASGRLDGHWERGLKPWDIAAGALLVTEAGGVVTSYEQTPFHLFSDTIVASNPAIQQSLNHELNIARQNPINIY